MRKGLRKQRFEVVFKSGKRISTRHFRLASDQGVGRVGIATSKKIGCHARRNWVKRRIREGLFRLESELKTNLDYILIASPAVVEVDLPAIVEELRDALNRMNQRWAEESESS